METMMSGPSPNEASHLLSVSSDKINAAGAQKEKDKPQPSKTRRFRLITLVLCGGTVGVIAYLGLGWKAKAVSTRHKHKYLSVQDEQRDSDTLKFKWKGPTTQLAFIGNSMFYFNDFPRFFETFSAGRITQNSCLHGGASIPSILKEGNAMYPNFETKKAIIKREHNGHVIYDYGACTVPQLLTGTDARLDDPGYAISDDKNDTNNLNPCRTDPAYLKFAERTFAEANTSWDFILINDNTRNPARRKTRSRSLQFLETFYVPWLLQNQPLATPVFLWTHAYSLPVESTPTSTPTTLDIDMTGLEDVANFTSLTFVGYKDYAELLKRYLPKSREPRIAPVGLAFLVVYEEKPDLWHELFHCADHLHASPSGTFLQGCIVYYTLFGEMPDRKYLLMKQHRRDLSSLWRNARMMQHAWEPANPIPNRTTAEYLFKVAERVMVKGHVPKSFIDYQNDEAVEDNGR